MRSEAEIDLDYTMPAHRLARTIATVKVILLLVLGLSTVFSLGSGDGTVTLISIIGGICSLLTIYVVFGWFEHTLRMLARIVEHTGGTAETPDLPLAGQH